MTPDEKYLDDEFLKIIVTVVLLLLVHFVSYKDGFRNGLECSIHPNKIECSKGAR